MAGLSLCLLLVVGLLAWAVTDDDPYVAPAPSPAPAGQIIQPALATETLASFQQAVVDDDEDAARALAPEGDTDTADRLAGIVRNADQLGVDDFTLRYVDAQDSLSRPDDSWSAAVDATWEFHGFDRAPARAEILVRLENDGDRVALTGFGGGDRVSPLWLAAPLQVRRTARTLVLVDGTAAAADGYARRATAAVPVVRRVLPQWRRGLVVEVPSSVDALDRTLDADAGTYDQIAAVTTAADGSLAPDAPVHVFVNPDVFGSLRPTGAQVVMSHEATHVATDAWVSQLPLWLLEGFADYVALRDVDLPLSVTAAQIAAEVKHHGTPRELPTDEQFNTSTTHLGASYEAAWLACRTLAERGSEAELVAYYDAVKGGGSPGVELKRIFSFAPESFLRSWQRRLQDLAG